MIAGACKNGVRTMQEFSAVRVASEHLRRGLANDELDDRAQDVGADDGLDDPQALPLPA